MHSIFWRWYRFSDNFYRVWIIEYTMLGLGIYSSIVYIYLSFHLPFYKVCWVMTAVYMQARINTNVETCKYVEKCSNFWCILKFQYIISLGVIIKNSPNIVKKVYWNLPPSKILCFSRWVLGTCLCTNVRR